MNTLIRGVIALLYCSLCIGASDSQSLPLDGYWSGSAERDGIKHDVAIRLVTREGQLSGTVDWPSMGYFRTDLLRVSVEGTDVQLSVPLPLGSINLIGTVGKSSTEVEPTRSTLTTITGTLDPIGLVKGAWQSLGAGGTFELKRSREPQLPYKTEDVRFASADVTLAGTLFLPLHGQKHPAVVYIAGSGDTTRGDGSFLADRLARAGIVALVYDKRGVGQSTGDWHQGGFDELAGDAIAALRLLQGRADIDAGTERCAGSSPRRLLARPARCGHSLHPRRGARHGTSSAPGLHRRLSSIRTSCCADPSARTNRRSEPMIGMMVPRILSPMKFPAGDCKDTPVACGRVAEFYRWQKVDCEGE